VTLDGAISVLRNTCNVFATMSPVCPGRVPLPGNLSVCVCVPNGAAWLVVELSTILHSARAPADPVPDDGNGYAKFAHDSAVAPFCRRVCALGRHWTEDCTRMSAVTTARMVIRGGFLVQVFATLASHLSAAEHYDFGLRTICTVLSASAAALQSQRGADEDEVAAVSLISVVGAAVLPGDRALFNGVVRDAFDGVFVGTLDAPLESAAAQKAPTEVTVRAACERARVGAMPSFLDKCSEYVARARVRCNAPHRILKLRSTGYTRRCSAAGVSLLWAAPPRERARLLRLSSWLCAISVQRRCPAQRLRRRRHFLLSFQAR
jgi:Hydrolytic ATP binding site of dynein motor region